MGTLKVDNLQKRDGTALITDGAASTNLLSQAALRSAGVGLIKLSTTDITSATPLLTFDNTLITDNYDKYMLSYQGLNPVTQGAKLRSRYSTDNGSSFETGTFNYGYQYSRLGSSAAAQNGSTKTDYAVSDFSNHTTTADHASGMFSIDGLRDATLSLHIRHEFVQRSGTGSFYRNVAQEAWQYTKSVVINYIEFSLDSGNFADGTFTLYGVTK